MLEIQKLVVKVPSPLFRKQSTDTGCGREKKLANPSAKIKYYFPAYLIQVMFIHMIVDVSFFHPT